MDILHDIFKRNRERFGPAGVKATDIPALLDALREAMRFMEDCHEWNLGTLVKKRDYAMENIMEELRKSGNP